MSTPTTRFAPADAKNAVRPPVPQPISRTSLLRTSKPGYLANSRSLDSYCHRIYDSLVPVLEGNVALLAPPHRKTKPFNTASPSLDISYLAGSMTVCVLAINSDSSRRCTKNREMINTARRWRGLRLAFRSRWSLSTRRQDYAYDGRNLPSSGNVSLTNSTARASASLPSASVLSRGLVTRTSAASDRFSASGIVDHENLAAVFVRDHAAVALIPVQHDLLVETLFDHVSVDRDFGLNAVASVTCIGRYDLSSGCHPAPGRQLSGECIVSPCRWLL